MSSSNNELPGGLIAFLNNPMHFFRLLKPFLGDAEIKLATKTRMMSMWQVQVLAVIAPQDGQMLIGAPQARLFRNSTPVRGPVDMQPYFMPLNLWVANFFSVDPEPNYAQIDVLFHDSLLGSQPKSDVEPVVLS